MRAVLVSARRQQQSIDASIFVVVGGCIIVVIITTTTTSVAFAVVRRIASTTSTGTLVGRKSDDIATICKGVGKRYAFSNLASISRIVGTLARDGRRALVILADRNLAAVSRHAFGVRQTAVWLALFNAGAADRIATPALFISNTAYLLMTDVRETALHTVASATAAVWCKNVLALTSCRNTTVGGAGVVVVARSANARRHVWHSTITKSDDVFSFVGLLEIVASTVAIPGDALFVCAATYVFRRDDGIIACATIAVGRVDRRATSCLC